MIRYAPRTPRMRIISNGMDETRNQETRSGIGEQFVNAPIAIGTPWRLFVFSLLLFALSLLVYFGLKVGYENYLNARSSALDQSIAGLASSVSAQDEQKFVAIYSQIVNLKGALGNHLFTGNLFPFLEKNTLPRVYFTEAKFASAAGNLDLSGQADSLQTLAAQMAQFEKAPELTKAILTSMNFNPSGGTSFSMTLTFNSAYLSKPL